MSAFVALVLRELRSHRVSPVAWVSIALYLLVAGWMFFSLLARFGEILADYALYARLTANPAILERINLNEIVVSGLQSSLLLLFLFLVPVLTMRAWAEERRGGTDELLLTAPVGPGTIVLAKYAALLIVVLGMLAGSGVFIAMLFRYGDPEPGPVAAGYLGLALASAALAALGLAASSLARSQVSAAVSSFVLFLGLYVIDWPAAQLEGGRRALLVGLSLADRFERFPTGLVTLADVVYFLSLAAVGLFLARAAIVSQRWR